MLKTTTDDANSICSDDALTNETVEIKEKNEDKEEDKEDTKTFCKTSTVVEVTESRY